MNMEKARAALLYGSGILLLSLEASAHAQDRPGSDVTVEAVQDDDTQTKQAGPAGNDIVVTARRREERLQEVPLAITVVDRKQLSDKNIDSPLDLAKYTPNFHFYSANGRQDTSALFIRGLNANTTDTRYQNITFFIDGVPVNGTVIGLPTASIQQVEIIKGPQSATFGRATYSGAVNYISTNPTPDTIEGVARGRYVDTARSGRASYLGEVVLRAPLIKDQLWAEVSGSIDRKGALFLDRATGAELGRTQTREAALILYAKPSENLSIKFRGAYDRDDDSAPALIQQGPRQWARAGTLITLPSGLLWSSKLVDPLQVGGCSAQGRAKPYDCGTTRDKFFASLVVNYDLDSGYQLVYRGGYGYQRNHALNDLWYASVVNPLYSDLPTPNKGTSNFIDPGERFENTSQQIELLSPTDGTFSWRVGSAFYYESAVYYQTFGFGTLVSAANPEGKQRGKLWSRNVSVFAGADWTVAHGLTFSFEGRVERQTVGSDACTVCYYYKPFDQQTSNVNFLPRVTAKYDLTSNNSVYALFARGTRPPRYNDTQSPAYPLAQAEWLNNYEVGSKNSFLDGRLVVNVAGFYQKLSNQQYRTLVPGTSTQSIQNVASSRVYGGEIETALKISTRFSLSGGVGYANHKFTSSINLAGTGASTTNLFPPGRADVLGLTTYNTPRLNGNVSFEARSRTFGNGAYLSLQGDWIYTGSQYADLANVQEISPSNEFNARLAYEAKLFSIAIFGANLSDDNTPAGANLGGTRACLFIVPEYRAAQQACNVAGMRRPRQIGVETRIRF